MRAPILLFTLALAACAQPLEFSGAGRTASEAQLPYDFDSEDFEHDSGDEDENEGSQDAPDPQDEQHQSVSRPLLSEVNCSDNMVSGDAVDALVILSDPATLTDIYETEARIDAIASIFESCQDPWGLFPTTYRHITRRIIKAIENREIEDDAWGRRIVLDFAGRYFANLQAVLSGGDASYAWDHYYYLADRSDVSRTRAVVVAMVAHLTLDLPHALVAVESTEEHEDDYFVLGELMIEIAPDFIEELRAHYDTDPEDLLNGFFFGQWVDGVFGEDTTMTLNYQTIRTKSWNNRWLLQQGWGGWVADAEIYSAFWTIDGILATLDAAGTI